MWISFFKVHTDFLFEGHIPMIVIVQNTSFLIDPCGIDCFVFTDTSKSFFLFIMTDFVLRISSATTDEVLLGAPYAAYKITNNRTIESLHQPQIVQTGMAVYLN